VSTDAVASEATRAEEVPLTPELVESENRRMDVLFIGGSVLVLAFFLGTVLENSADFYLRLATGRAISQTFPLPPAKDTLSLATEPDRTWVNPSWLYDFGLYQLHESAGELGLGIAKAILATIPALLLLGIRHRGPTLWWTCIVTAIAAIAFSYRTSVLTSDALGLSLFIGGLACYWKSRVSGSPIALYLIPLLTVLYANVDVTWPLLPLIILMVGAGEVIQQSLPSSLELDGRKPSMAWVTQLLVVGAVSLGCGIVNPWHIGGLLHPIQWLTTHIGVLPPGSRSAWDGLIDFSNFIDSLGQFFQGLGERRYQTSPYAWVALALLAFAGVVLNFGKFSVPRVFLLAVGVLMPLYLQITIPFASALLAIVSTLSFQEAWVEALGRKTRIGIGWLIWSQGGRFVTVLGMAVIIVMTFTGRVSGEVGAMNRFGLGIAREVYSEPVAEFLAELKPEGNVVLARPLSKLGPYLTYRLPDRKAYFDSRWQLYSPEHSNEVLEFFSRLRLGKYEDGVIQQDRRTGLVVSDPNPDRNKSPDAKKDAAPKPDGKTPAPKATTPDAGKAAKPAEAKPAEKKTGIGDAKPVESKPVTTEAKAAPKADPVAAKAGSPKANPASRPGAQDPSAAPAVDIVDREVKGWRSIADKYKFSVIVLPLDLENEIELYARLIASGTVAPLFISDRAVVLGRIADVPDAERFRKMAIRSNQIAFKTQRDLDQEDKDNKPLGIHNFPVGPDFADFIWKRNARVPPGFSSGNVYLAATPGSTFRLTADQRPGNIFLAIRKFNEALENNPSHDRSFMGLAQAYNEIVNLEAAVTEVAFRGFNERLRKELGGLDGKAPVAGPNPAPAPAGPPGAMATAELEARMLRLPSNRGTLTTAQFSVLRHRQLMAAAMGAAISQPGNITAHMMLTDLCQANGLTDLAEEHARMVLGLIPPQQRERFQPTVDALSLEAKQQRERFDLEIKAREEARRKEGMDVNDPFERFFVARQLGLVKLAITDLESAVINDQASKQRDFFLLDQYLICGYAQKAFDVIQNLREFPGYQPGDFEFNMACLHVIRGDYRQATVELDAGIARLRAGLASRHLGMFEAPFRGGEVFSLPNMAGQFGSDAQKEGFLLTFLGMIRLEMGRPEDAAKTFRKALETGPNQGTRPVIAFYLKQITGEDLDPLIPSFDFDKEMVVKRFDPPKEPAKPAAGPGKPGDGKPGDTKPSGPAAKPAAAAGAADATKGAPAAKQAPTPSAPAESTPTAKPAAADPAKKAG
jgi:tetratricopeptide (TPR) repeat protein